MLKKTVKTIHSFRIFFLFFISLMVMIQFGLNPVALGKFIGAKIGLTIGMSAGVPENPFSKLALQLKEKEEKLAAKEKELDGREAVLNDSGLDPVNVFLISGLGLLFVLVLLNYYLDFKRKKKFLNK